MTGFPVRSLQDTSQTGIINEKHIDFYEERAIADFDDYYNCRRYHKALGNVAPADVLYGRREEILERLKEVQIQTINRRRNYNRGLRELANAA